MSPEEIIKKLASLEVFVLDGDIRIYHAQLSELPVGAEVLDIGTGWGKSALAMAMSAPHLIIDSIDTGEFQIATGWATDQEDYVKKLGKQFAKYGVANIRFSLRDALVGPKKGERYDLIHIDMVEGHEQEVFKKWTPAVKRGGVMLLRNHSRFPDELLPKHDATNERILVIK